MSYRVRGDRGRYVGVTFQHDAGSEVDSRRAGRCAADVPAAGEQLAAGGVSHDILERGDQGPAYGLLPDRRAGGWRRGPAQDPVSLRCRVSGGRDISEPEADTPRRAQYDLCVNALVLDAYDKRGTTVSGSALTDNREYRGPSCSCRPRSRCPNRTHEKGRPGGGRGGGEPMRSSVRDAEALFQGILEDLREVDTGFFSQVIEPALKRDVLADGPHVVGPAVGIKVHQGMDAV